MTIAALEGREVPLGSAIDAEGRPTVDPVRGLEGAQLPFGGAKGSNIALMVELLAAGLTGATTSADTAVPPEAGHPGGAPTANGELILALDPSRCPGGAEHAERIFQCIAAEAEHGARLPSEVEGIRVAASTYAAIEPMLSSAS